MKELNEYSKIYSLGKRTILVHRDECQYSVLLEDDDSYTEVIVSAESMDDAMKFPDSDKLSWTGQFKLLFGNFDGFDYFIKFCDENFIETRTFTWSK